MSDKKALVVIDLQNDYLWEKRKPKFTYDTKVLIHNVNEAITSYKADGYDIIYIKHILSKLLWGVGFSIRGTEGAEYYDGVKIVSDLVFEKNWPDSYTSKTFREYMKKEAYSEVVLCGIDECGCVGATAKGAAKTGVKVKMLSDCIGSKFSDSKCQKMRDKLKGLGIQYI